MATVKVGGNERTLEPFSAAKAIEATMLVGEILEKSNQLVDDMTALAAEHAQRTAVRVPRATAFYQDPEGAGRIPDSAWDASGQVLEVPGKAPSGEQLVVMMFPKVMRVAREEVLKLLALVLITERELEDKDTQGPDVLQAALVEQGRKLRFDLKMPELFGLARAAWEATQEELKADPTTRAMLNRLLGVLGSQSVASSSEPSSSTGSPTGTAGRGKKSSSGSRGASSKRSTPSS